MRHAPQSEPTAPVPPRLTAAVAMIAAAVLVIEIVVTRLFSVLFFYHFSFLAVCLVMSGGVIGGLWAARWDAARMEPAVFDDRLAAAGAAFAANTLFALFFLVALAPRDLAVPSVFDVALHALVFLPGLVAAGAFLALAFARARARIGSLYAWDLAGAAVGCLASIALLRMLEGPAALLCPTVLAASAALLLAKGKLTRAVSIATIAVSALALTANIVTAPKVLRLRAESPGRYGRIAPMFERWNEHSRVQAFDVHGRARYLVIDRAAGTAMRAIPSRADGRPVAPEPSWAEGEQYAAYRLGRPLHRVAVIGVGGGSDLLPPIWYGAERVDAYELNQIFIDLLERDFATFDAIASRPEVHLLHAEGRVGIARSHERYDVIQASMIDTWAATASGGFVLSENGLYTRDGFRVFLEHLSPTGILTMTRWYIPDAPAETQRLVALAAAALSDAGVRDATPNVALIRSQQARPGVPLDESTAFTGGETRSKATILISKQPFSEDEVARLVSASKEGATEILTAPGLPSKDAAITRLLVEATRTDEIRASRFDISVPTDSKPYFFLQLRPSDWPTLARSDFGPITQITFNGVRVLMALGAAAIALLAVVLLRTLLGTPGRAASASSRRTYRYMAFYFLGIGLGYMLVQLGLHQRLILILGHPSLSLSVVLFSMLVGTGLGAASSSRLFPRGRLRDAGTTILVVLGAAVLGVPFIRYIDVADSLLVRAALAALVVTPIGFALGIAFPLGVCLVSQTGESATQRMWALNGAASIAGSVFAAIVGFTMGSTSVLASGLVMYAVATLAGTLAERTVTHRGAFFSSTP